MAASPTSSAVERGRSLFNARRYFEAHEAWEEAWLAETGEPRLFLQGLIQIAASLHKASRGGSASGCVRLIDAGLEKLGRVRGGAGGLALGRFRSDVTAFRTRAEAWRRGESDRAGPPYPRLLLSRSASAVRKRPARTASTRTRRSGES